MTARNERLEYEQKTSALAGQCIHGVTYCDVRNFSTEPRAWDYGDWRHAVMGVELVTDRGPSSVLWTSTFYPYGVEVFPQPISQHLAPGPDGPQGWPAHDHPEWKSRQDYPVQAVDIFWEQFEVGPAYRLSDNAVVGQAHTYTVPIALRLDFEPGPVWMVAGMPQWPDPENVFVPADEIMVVFTADRMRRIGFPETGFLHPGHATTGER